MKISLTLKIERGPKRVKKNEPMTPGQKRYFSWTGWSTDGHTKRSAGDKIREDQFRRTSGTGRWS